MSRSSVVAVFATLVLLAGTPQIAAAAVQPATIDAPVIDDAGSPVVEGAPARTEELSRMAAEQAIATGGEVVVDGLTTPASRTYASADGVLHP
ncbi:hypothetical protein [Microbacterium binotii]|uniref:hypothetical protein n=1 Tax=Microbacterium binotii TaxID=462710 RepID=UPI001F3079F0|nr:hypothetical protein [Microbacterium binotii]UIN30679.1 hypothetical protein LXM64_00285 [Microbacterium binotii]